MRAEDQLQYMADFYPELCPTRRHCLNHLFCVIGNGFEWVNGELVCIGDEYEKRYKLRKSIKKAEFWREDNWNKMHEFYKSLRPLDNGHKIPIQYDFRWYPLSKRYSALFTYPEDVKSDWIDLITECQNELLKDGIDPDDAR